MVAMHGCRDSDLRQSSAHELKNDHLCSSILTSDSIRSQVKIRLAADDFLFFWIIKMTIEYFLRVSQWSLESLFDNINVIGEFPKR